MRRRTLLAAVGGSLPTAGCLSGEGDGERTGTPTATPVDPSNGEDRRYQECSREVVPYDQLPDDVRAEVDAALDGGYEADRVYLREAMDVEGSYVSVGDDYYDPTVTAADGSETLELRLVEPKALPDARPVSVEHRRDDERTVSVELVADDGTTLVEGTRELGPGDDVEFGRTHRVGSHDLRVAVAEGDATEAETTETVRIVESRFSVIVRVEPDGIAVSGVVAELDVCRYEE